MKLFFGEFEPAPRLNEEEQTHISRVLRLKEGEIIHLTNGQGKLARATLTYSGKYIGLENLEMLPTPPAFSRKLHIAIAPTKNIDRTEFFIEKAVEMGVSEITFLLCDHSERKIINLEKIQKQVLAAAKQSLRVWFPKINTLTRIPEFLASQSPESLFVAHCDPNFERINLAENHFPENCTFMIGPEGDFSPKEILSLQENGVCAVSLGRQRLRTETAGVFVAAWNYFQMMG